MGIFEEIAQAKEKGRSVCLCMVVETDGAVPRHTGSKMLVYADGSMSGTVGGGEVEQQVYQVAQEALKDGQPRLLSYTLDARQEEAVGVCGGSMKVYIEPINQPAKIVVIGAGHVGKSVARLAKHLNFRVLVSDERAELCNHTLIPEADGFYPVKLQDLPDQIEIDANTFLVLVTHSAEVEIAGLPRLLETNPAYIGVIGSLNRGAHTRKALLDAGVSEEKIRKIKSPIGVDIHAETPDEIAVSILAEIIEVKNHLKYSR